MIPQAPRADPFKEQLRESLQRETLNSRSVKIARHANVYTCGDQDEIVYFIESGRIKLLMLSPEGKECLVAIHSAGDIFGELCLCGLGERLETATAMEATVLKQIPSAQLLARLSRARCLRGLSDTWLRAHRRPAAGHRRYGDGGQRAAIGQDAVAVGAHTGQEGPTEHAHRTEDIASYRMTNCPRWWARRGRGSACLCSDFTTSGCLRPTWIAFSALMKRNSPITWLGERQAMSARGAIILARIVQFWTAISSASA